MTPPLNPLVAASAVLLALSSCSNSGSSAPQGGDTGVGDPGVEGEAALTVFANSADPRLLLGQYTSGQTVQYFGERGSDGVPTGVYAVSVQDASGTARFDLDDQGRPVRLESAAGERYLLDWQADGAAAALTAISPDGTFQISTELLFGGVSGLEAGGPNFDAPLAYDRTGISTTFRARLGFIGPDTIPNFTSFGVAPGAVQTTVSICGVESAGTLPVTTNVFDNADGELLLSVPAQFLGGGLYSASIPVGQIALENDEQTCQSIASVLDLVCLALDGAGGVSAFNTQFCASIDAAIEVISGGSMGAGVYTFPGCVSLLESLELYCSTISQGDGPDAPALDELLCTASFVNFELPDMMRIESCVAGVPADACSVPMIVPSDATFPVLNSIDLGTDSAIQSLVLVPSAPAAGQGYVATARMTCLPMGANVRMAIVGTDGYTDEENFTISNTQAEGSFDLGVPGASQGVQDTVTADLELPGGNVLTRTAFLVFGS